jgi:hypothetical protein
MLQRSSHTQSSQTTGSSRGDKKGSTPPAKEQRSAKLTSSPWTHALGPKSIQSSPYTHEIGKEQKEPSGLTKATHLKVTNSLTFIISSESDVPPCHHRGMRPDEGPIRRPEMGEWMGADKNSSPKRELSLDPKFTTKDSHTSLPRSRSHDGRTNPRNKHPNDPKAEARTKKQRT